MLPKFTKIQLQYGTPVIEFVKATTMSLRRAVCFCPIKNVHFPFYPVEWIFFLGRWLNSKQLFWEIEITVTRIESMAIKLISRKMGEQTEK